MAEGKSRIPAEVSLNPNSAAEHSIPSETHTSHLFRRDALAGGQHRPHQRHRHMISNSDVMRPADDGQHLRPDLDTTHQEAPGAGMGGDVDDPADDDTFERCAPVLYRLRLPALPW